jgi:predicted acetyltransferase
MSADLQPAPVPPEEFEAFALAVARGFHDELDEERLERFIRPIHEHHRALAIRDAGRMVATATIATFEVTAPGGPVPMAGVTAVTVQPTHRRRGLLTSLMRAQLEGLRDGGEAVAGLWASEARIYGRFGYGPATREGELVVRADRTALRRDVRVADGAVETLPPAAALDALRAIHDAVRPGRAGMLSRSDGRWTRTVDDPESERNGAKPMRAAVLRDAGGTPRAYALYAVRMEFDRGEHAGEAVVREIVADGPPATAAIWQHLLGLDLVRTVAWGRAPGDPEVLHLVDNPRVVRTDPGDGLWVRLVDVDRALAQRTNAREIDVVLEVEDAFCPWNAGRHRLSAGAGGASCGRTTDAADLRLDGVALGSVYLGGPSLRAFADAGRVQELTPGALEAATVALRGAREPWCPDMF